MVGEMLVVETVARIRRAHFVQGKRIKGIKEIARELGVARNTVQVAGDRENTATQSRTLSPGQVNRPDLAAHACPESPQPRPCRMGFTGGLPKSRSGRLSTPAWCFAGTAWGLAGRRGNPPATKTVTCRVIPRDAAGLTIDLTIIL